MQTMVSWVYILNIPVMHLHYVSIGHFFGHLHLARGARDEPGMSGQLSLLVCMCSPFEATKSILW